MNELIYLVQAGNRGWECYEPLREFLPPSSLGHYVIDGLRRGSYLLSSLVGPSGYWAWAFQGPFGRQRGIIGGAGAGFGCGRNHGWVVEGQNVSPGSGQRTRSFGRVLRAVAFDGAVDGDGSVLDDRAEGVIAFAFGGESRRWLLKKDVSEELVIVSAVTLPWEIVPAIHFLHRRKKLRNNNKI